MTDLSGIESNKVFRTGAASGAPYYYIDAYLDVSHVSVPQETGEITLYFNKDNNYDYLDPLKSATYSGFYPIESNAVIGEVAVYSNPDVVASLSGVLFNVGGAVDLSSPVTETWGGKTGYTSGLLTPADINSGSICYFGHEGADVLLQEGKFLAVTISGSVLQSVQADAGRSKKAQRALRKGTRAPRLVADPSFSSGVLHVVVKVYPKFQ